MPGKWRYLASKRLSSCDECDVRTSGKCGGCVNDRENGNFAALLPLSLSVQEDELHSREIMVSPLCATVQQIYVPEFQSQMLKHRGCTKRRTILCLQFLVLSKKVELVESIVHSKLGTHPAISCKASFRFSGMAIGVCDRYSCARTNGSIDNTGRRAGQLVQICSTTRISVG